MADSQYPKNLLVLALGVFMIVWPQSLRADAWTQPAGHGQIIVKFAHTDISHQFDETGRVTPFGDNGNFRKTEINPYLEYGLNSRTTLIVNAFLPALRYSNDYGSQKSVGLGDVETGIRRRLNSPESSTAISAQFSVQLPTYSEDRNPAPGNHQADTEARLMAGRGFTLGGRHGFVSMGAGYRYRSGAPADQIRSDASVGYDLTRRFMVIAQTFGMTGLRNGKPIQAITNPNLRSDFDLYKAQLSVVARMTRSTRVQFAWNNAVAGRNTGNGQTFMFAIWKDF